MKTNKIALSILTVCLLFLSVPQSSAAGKQKKRAAAEVSDREYWTGLAYKMAEPVLYNMSRGELKKNMPLEYSPLWNDARRNKGVVYMECFGRLMAGIAPWLALPDDDTAEGAKRKQLREWALASYAHAVDPGSPDYLLWDGCRQTLVDAAYLAQSFIRAPEALWEPLDDLTKQRYIEEFRGLRRVRPAYNNWLLFRGIIEAFLVTIGEEYDAFALDVSVRKMNEWYVGDGWYSDGSNFTLNYYSSYVIHAMYLDMLEIMEGAEMSTPISSDLALKRMQRYNILLERLISPEATFPPIGRSSTYRMGAFQSMALAAWKYGVPKPLTNGSVRNALTSVMKRMFSAEGNFSADGYLQLGMVGHQPDISDFYTNNGSLYITALVFLPLGLPADNDFWTAAPEEWTSQKAWGGKPFKKDSHKSLKTE